MLKLNAFLNDFHSKEIKQKIVDLMQNNSVPTKEIFVPLFIHILIGEKIR